MKVRPRDINVDVLGHVFNYASRYGSNISACKLVCRSWCQAAKGKMCYSIDLNMDYIDASMKKMVGLWLQKTIGYDLFPVKILRISLEKVDDLSSVRNIARLVPYLSNLKIYESFAGSDTSTLFEVMSIFFENCPRITALSLSCNDFGAAPLNYLTDVIKE
jgi:hypothetical protein